MLKRLTALIRYIVLMFAVYARIEAMKAANAERALRGESPSYGESHFSDEAVPLSGILTTSLPGSTRSCDRMDTTAAKTLLTFDFLLST